MTFSGQFNTDTVAYLFNSNPEGATWIFEPKNNRRYVVGLGEDAPTQHLDRIIPMDIVVRRDVYADVPSDGLGIWLNPETGLTELDTVRTFDDYTEAMQCAIEQKQICFYDNEMEACVYTNEQSIAV